MIYRARLFFVSVAVVLTSLYLITVSGPASAVPLGPADLAAITGDASCWVGRDIPFACLSCRMSEGFSFRCKIAKENCTCAARLSGQPGCTTCTITAISCPGKEDRYFGGMCGTVETTDFQDCQEHFDVCNVDNCGTCP